jgi:hypothetical protein
MFGENTLGEKPTTKAGELDSVYQSIYCIPNLYTSLMGIPSDVVSEDAKKSLTDMLTEVATTLLSQKTLDFAWVGLPIFTSLRNLMVEENFETDERGFFSIKEPAPALLHAWLDFGGIKMAALQMLADAQHPNAYHAKMKELLAHFEREFFRGIGGGGLHLKLVSYGAVRLDSTHKYTPVSEVARVIYSYAKGSGLNG